MTEKLYLQDPYTMEFEAEVIRTLPLEKGFGIILNRTYFHPEGGGQPDDTGTLNGLPLMGLVDAEDGEVIHIVESELTGLVLGKIDWSTRFDYMQQHTGQHILSQAALRVAEAPTTGWRLVSPVPNIDIVCPDLTENDIMEIENLANRIIYENREVKAYYVADSDTIDSLPLRKKPLARYFSEQGIRIVEVDGFEYIPCGGTHCTRTGEVGVIVIQDWNKRGSDWHIQFACGKRALVDYQEKRTMLRTMRHELTVPENEISTRVMEMIAEVSDLKRLADETQEELLAYKAMSMVHEADMIGRENVRIVTDLLAAGDVHQLKALASKITVHPKTIAILGDQGARASLVVARSDDVEYNASAIIRQLCEEFDGRGGGRPNLAQAGGFDPGKMADVLKRAKDITEDATD